MLIFFNLKYITPFTNNENTTVRRNAYTKLIVLIFLPNITESISTERKRELATLKVLGFYDKEVTEYVYRENILLTLIGSVFGMLLGKILHRFIIVTVEIDSVMFGRNINTISFVYAFLFLLHGDILFKMIPILYFILHFSVILPC